MESNIKLFNNTLLKLLEFVKENYKDHDLVSSYESKLNIVFFVCSICTYISWDIMKTINLYE